MPAVKDKQAVSQSADRLVPLIKDELEAGREAEESGVEHYRRAGQMLREAKALVPHGEWMGWLKRHFQLSHASAKVYMSLAKSEKATTSSYSSLNEFRKEELGYKQTVHPPPYQDAVKTALPDPALIERLRQDTQRRTDEAKLARELGFKLIDIGYKVLATKLHPDKGGSKEAMERLNYVRDRLKKALPVA